MSDKYMKMFGHPKFAEKMKEVVVGSMRKDIKFTHHRLDNQVMVIAWWDDEKIGEYNLSV